MVLHAVSFIGDSVELRLISSSEVSLINCLVNVVNLSTSSCKGLLNSG